MPPASGVVPTAGMARRSGPPDASVRSFWAGAAPVR